MIKMFTLLVLITASTFASENYLVVVGELVGVNATQCEKVRDMDRECTQMYIATYRSVYVVSGSLQQDRTVKVRIEEDDLRLSSESKFVLLDMLSNDEFGSFVHGIYSHDVLAVHRTVDGRYALCGCPAVDRRYHESDKQQFKKACSPVEFKPVMIDDLTHASTYLRSLYRTNGSYKVRDNQATCVRGIYVDDLVHTLME